MTIEQQVDVFGFQFQSGTIKGSMPRWQLHTLPDFNSNLVRLKDAGRSPNHCR